MDILVKIKKEELKCIRCDKYGEYVGIINDYHQCYCNDCLGQWIVKAEIMKGEVS